MRNPPDIVYTRRGDLPLHLSLYLPDEAPEPLPLIVWFVGGGWEQCKYHCPDLQYLVEAGFAVASVQYRISSQASAPANIHDARAAVHYLRAYAAELNLDPQRVGLLGSSAGGQTALVLAMSEGVPELAGDDEHLSQSTTVRAVGSIAGPTDLVALTTPPLSLKHPDRLSRRERYLGGPAAQKQDVARLVSPITYATVQRAPSLPPILLLHGQDDEVVWPEQSIRLAQALRNAGADVTLHLFPGVGHSGRSHRDIQAAAADFFRRTLLHLTSRARTSA